MEGRVPVKKLGGLSLPLESPARKTLKLLRTNKWVKTCVSVPGNKLFKLLFDLISHLHFSLSVCLSVWERRKWKQLWTG